MPLPLRTLLLAALLPMACASWTTSTPGDSPAPAEDPARPDLAPLQHALDAWQAEPGPDTLSAVGTAVEPHLQSGPGPLDRERVIAHALSTALLRADLARPRLAPHGARLEGADLDLWLDTLLRVDPPALAEALQTHHGIVLDPDHSALARAHRWARTDRSVGWRDAVRAVRATDLAEAQVTYGRRALDRPVDDLPAALAVLPRLLPGWTLEAVVTRAALPADPDPDTTPGSLTASRGQRRIVAYGEGPPGEALADVGDALMTAAPPRSVGLVVRAVPPSGPPVILCGEGQLDQGTLILRSACDPAREAAWLDAAEAFSDHIGSGATPDQAGERIRTTYGEVLRGG